MHDNRNFPSNWINSNFISHSNVRFSINIQTTETTESTKNTRTANANKGKGYFHHVFYLFNKIERHTQKKIFNTIWDSNIKT